MSARRLVLELGIRMNLGWKGGSTIPTTWENNVETQNLTNSKRPLMTACVKHIGIKYQWFRSKVEPDEIEMLRVSTGLLRVDIFTKELTQYAFKEKWQLVMSW